MRLTNEQRSAVTAEGSVLLNACPGSGKTRVIISKLVRVIESLRGSPRSVACITYTNAAVYEIEARLRKYIQIGDDSCADIGTIHSFCLNHIFRPYCCRLTGYQNGFKVLTPDCDDFTRIVTETCAELRRFNLRSSDFEAFASIQIDANGNPIGTSIDSGSVSVDEARRYWERQRANGYVDFANLLYYSLRLIQQFPEIADCIASRFAWMLIDEFQDTTEIQIAILSAIADRGRTQFFLVGDPYQSIYGFAGARPELADQFASKIQARKDLSISGNFRCCPGVIRHAEKLIPRPVPMRSVGRALEFAETPEYRHGSSALQVITDYFLPTIRRLSIPLGESAVLAPQWFSLLPVARGLREKGVPIVGPGARPYRRSRIFAPLAEQICGHLLEPSAETLVGIERALFNLVLEATGRWHFDIFTYRGRLVVQQLIRKAETLKNQCSNAMVWLRSAAADFSEILVTAGYLLATEAQVFAQSVKEMERDMRSNRIDLSALSLEDLGVYAMPRSALKLSTLHFSKGREYDAVAIIDLHEGRIPHSRSVAIDQINEARRLLYVGITRARRYLLYVTDSSDPRNMPSRFLCIGTGLGLC